MSSRRNWLIHCLPYDKKIGGTVVMHNLAKVLHDMGDVVFTTSKSPFDGIRQSSEDLIKSMDKRDWVVVVTEDVCHENSPLFFDSGNKCKFPNVVRWILYTLGGFAGYKGYYSPNEMVVQYGKSFTVATPYENCPELTNVVFEFDFWKDLRHDRKDEDLILIKKGRHFSKKIEHTGRILDEEDFNDVLLSAFNEHKRFITYDNATFHSVQAAVCGCISIVIPDGRLTEEQWRNTSRNRKWGIAYGDTDEQIKFALETRHLLISDLKSQVEDGKKQIEELRKEAIKRFPDQYKITCVIETEWKNMNLVNQLKKYQSDNSINQIIILDRDKDNRPDFVDFSKIEIIETVLDRIPAIELGIENAYNDLVIVASDKLKFDVTNLTKLVVDNKNAIRFLPIHQNSYLFSPTRHGFVKFDKINFEDSKIFDNLFVIRKTEFVKTPGLKKYGLSMWCDKIYKSKHQIILPNKIDGLEVDGLEIDKQQNDKKILDRFL